ncbi:MAG: MFS transporter, partial [Gammaproteobacteria bacterium]|nr:MFS transporter [Gammaproteobacteria bacterium]
FDPVGKKKFVQSCDVAKAALAKAGVPYRNERAPAGALGRVRVGTSEVPSVDGPNMSAAEFKAASDKFSKALGSTLKAAGYPAKADAARINYPMVLLLLVILVIYVTMVYGPIAAWLVELFPARIRYTSMSLPYHIGNGWFGGFLPTVAFALVALTGDIYYGLWYPIIVCIITVVVGALFLPETRDRHIR